MKFVTLALALFAVGCQAASLQADAPADPASLPSQLEHARAVMRAGLDQVRKSADAVADKVSDPETRDMFKKKTDEFYTHVLNLQGMVSPLTDGVVQTADEATRDLRATVQRDLDALNTELGPMRADLRATVLRHLDQYKELLAPLMAEYQNEQRAQMAAWKEKLEPVMAELRTKLDTNVEETKTKLDPIVKTLRAKFDERVTSMREMVDPYVQEYKEQVKQALSQASEVNYKDSLDKVRPHVDNLRTNFDNLLEEVKKMMGGTQ